MIVSECELTPPFLTLLLLLISLSVFALLLFNRLFIYHLREVPELCVKKKKKTKKAFVTKDKKMYKFLKNRKSEKQKLTSPALLCLESAHTRPFLRFSPAGERN